MLDSYGMLCGIAKQRICKSQLRAQGKALGEGDGAGEGTASLTFIFLVYIPIHTARHYNIPAVQFLKSFLDERSYIMWNPPGNYSSKLVFLFLHSYLRT